MPNTLAHFGVQGLLGHRFFSWIDPKWILLGCVIPDIPWILQRVVQSLAIPVDLYDLRLYAICQASLFGCLLLAGGLALMAADSKKVFFVLAINSLAHLLLDSTQLKWANGVHLFAPFSWDLWNLGWYWPESFVTYGMTALGIIYLGIIWRVAVDQPLISSPPGAGEGVVIGLCIIGYFVFPLVFMGQAELADNHFMKTLRQTEKRVGQVVEFDRVPYIKKQSGDVIQTVSKEHIQVARDPLPHSALVSVKGWFSTQKSIEVRDLHIHSSWFRDVASLLGLGIFLVLCIVSVVRSRIVGS